MRELFKHGLIYGFTSSLQNLLSFVLLPLFTIYYTPAEFGVYSLILLSGTLANAIFYLGAGSALGRFYFDDDTSSYRKRIISSALFVIVVAPSKRCSANSSNFIMLSVGSNPTPGV
jgi:O-antigen/teichoic acid export membrane protein